MLENNLKMCFPQWKLQISISMSYTTLICHDLNFCFLKGSDKSLNVRNWHLNCFLTAKIHMRFTCAKIIFWLCDLRHRTWWTWKISEMNLVHIYNVYISIDKTHSLHVIPTTRWSCGTPRLHVIPMQNSSAAQKFVMIMFCLHITYI